MHSNSWHIVAQFRRGQNVSNKPAPGSWVHVIISQFLLNSSMRKHSFFTCTGWTRVRLRLSRKDVRGHSAAPLKTAGVLHRARWGLWAKLGGKALLRALGCLLEGCNALFSCGIHVFLCVSWGGSLWAALAKLYYSVALRNTSQLRELVGFFCKVKPGFIFVHPISTFSAF